MTGWRLGYALGSGAGDQRDAEAAEPVDVESDFDRAEGGGGRAEGAAAVRGGDAAEYIQLARSRGERAAVDSGREVHHAGRRVLRVSQYLGILRPGRRESASDVAGRLLREAHVATVPGEGFGTSEHIRVSYATSKAELDRGLERMRKFFAGL